MSYSKLSQELTNNISKIEKKKDGIYFTPPDTIIRNLKLLSKHMKHIDTILEPSCGSGEYINYIIDKFNDKHIIAIESNEKIYNSIKDTFDSNVDLINTDYLTYNSYHPDTNSTPKKFDLIIGNPPFYVMKKSDINKSYHPYFVGRPNIFIAFILKSLEMLNKNGILSFILPKNFFNSLFYEKTRKYIYENYKILYLEECNDKYIETQQKTILLIIQNVEKTKTIPFRNNKKYTLIKNQNIVFGIPETIDELKKLYENSNTLSDLGFKVSVGTVVWNQCKNILTNDDSKTLLIYSSDIKDGSLNIRHYTNPEKKNYIEKKGLTGPLLVINRGYGVGRYNFQYCLINRKEPYLIENHLITIKPCKSDLSQEEVINLYSKIIKSLDDEKTKKFIRLFFGNNAINTTEINYILPIYS
jgi:adenine-specific DNA-methyltransferase